MILLRKGLYEFDKIVESGYEVDEQAPLIRETLLRGGKIKRIFDNYEAVSITVTLDGYNALELQELLANLTYGEYEYWSPKYKMMRTGMFVVDIPSIIMKRSHDLMDFEEVVVKLRKTYENG